MRFEKIIEKSDIINREKNRLKAIVQFIKYMDNSPKNIWEMFMQMSIDTKKLVDEMNNNKIKEYLKE